LEGEKPSAEGSVTLFAAPVLYCISDPANGDPRQMMVAAAENGIEFYQYRHLGLPPALRRAAALRLSAIPRHKTRLIINGDPDLARLMDADGVHYPFRERSSAGSAAPGGGCVGISVHSVSEARDAAGFGPHYLLAAPVYAPLSKAAQGPALGAEGLRRLCAEVDIPVIALGGMVPERFAEVLDAGAAGVAGITLFSRHEALAEIVKTFRDATRAV
jgi:thiamine-phosphate pyrophosphorylase